MARKVRRALPTGALGRLIEETDRAPRATRTGSQRMGTVTRRAGAGKLARKSAGRAEVAERRPGRDQANPFARNHDAVIRYAASRGVAYSGNPMDGVRLAVALAADLREVARRDRVTVLTVISRALAGYLTENA